MNFEYNNMQVRNLLGFNNKQLYIPRYQRDYSWEKKEVSEFVDDILSRIVLSNNNDIECEEYFFGTILLAGSFNEGGKEIEVVDGQQRITTMTIFLSAIAKCFYNSGDGKLGDLVWGYIMKVDDNGEQYKALKNDTNNQYFQYLIQIKGACNKEPIDEEQDRIKFAYEYCMEILKDKKIKKRLTELNNNRINFDKVEYLNLLKGIRDQLLGSIIICISTKDKKSANLIFEILNAKGKKLESIDLIKNSIFNYLNTVEPTDDANNVWKDIKNNLTSREARIEFPTFYRHYWISKYKKVKDDQLYNEFIKMIQPINYKRFLEDVQKMSNLYMQIVCPYLRDYGNKKQFMYIIECLDYVNNYFKIKQIRVALLSLFDARLNKNIVNNKKFKEILMYLHGFHFAYNALCTKSANTLEGKYSKFAIKLSKAKNKEEANNIIDKLKEELNSIFPTYNEFEQEFIKLEFSKKYNTSNMLSKYVLNNLEKYYSKLDVARQDGSVEHIRPENETERYSLNIGNLILLEEKINGECEDKKLTDKLVKYKDSHYVHISQFVKTYVDITQWNKKIIEERSIEMASYYYYDVLGQRKL